MALSTDEVDPKGTTMLTRAAESIAASGRAPTVADLLHNRALQHYAEGLRQYLCIRLGGVEAGAAALGQLQNRVAESDADALIGPPGIRSRLYRLARELSFELTAAPKPCLPWRKASVGAHEACLEALRSGLHPEEAELLELRHARELRPAEIAFVFEQPVEDILEALDNATQHARKLLPEPGNLRRKLLEAFALRRDLRLESTLGEETDRRGIPAPLPTGRIIAGRYRIQARVGTGAFGDVYRAEDAEVPGHVVALKLLHEASYSPEAREKALRELRWIASVFHPSVVQFKDHGWWEERLWFVMPWYNGETLESRLQRGPLSREEALAIFQPLSRGLAAVHAAGIRHQDVKPDNVFLAEIPGEGSDAILPVLIDLGVAATEAEMLVAGTPTYFAPEVAAQFASVPDKPRVTTKADVFSLALSLRNALEPETQEDVPAGAVETFVETRARMLPEFPKAKSLRFLKPNFERWLHEDAAKRPTAEEFAEELAALVAPEKARRQRRRLYRYLVPLLVVAAAGITGLAGFYENRRASQELEAEQARVEAVAAQQDLERSEERRRGVERSAAALAENRSQLEAALAASETVVGRYETDLQRREDALESTRERLDSTQQHLVAERQARQNDADAHADALAEERRRIAALEGQAETLEARLGDAQRARQRAVDSEATLQEELTSLQGTLESLRSQLASARRQRDASREAQSAAEEESQRLTEELVSAHSRAARLQGQLRELRQASRPVPAEAAAPEETPGI